jgi:hypothetical protein
MKNAFERVMRLVSKVVMLAEYSRKRWQRRVNPVPGHHVFGNLARVILSAGSIWFKFTSQFTPMTQAAQPIEYALLRLRNVLQADSM